MLKRILLLVLLGVLVTACSGGAETGPGDDALIPINLPLGYIPNVQFAPLYVSVEKGYFREAGVEVEFDYSFETDAVALVGADDGIVAAALGRHRLAFSSFDRLFRRDLWLPGGFTRHGAQGAAGVRLVGSLPLRQASLHGGREILVVG